MGQKRWESRKGRRQCDGDRTSLCLNGRNGGFAKDARLFPSACKRSEGRLGIERRSIMEGNTIAQLEGPCERVIRGLPSGREPGLQNTVLIGVSKFQVKILLRYNITIAIYGQFLTTTSPKKELGF